MRNAWKGLVVGALTGAAVGMAIDLVDATARTAQRGAAKAADTMSGHSSEHHREPEHPIAATRIRNAWKGLAVGGLTGAAVGIAIDFVDGTARTAQRGAAMATGAVGAHLPDAIDRTKEAATRATHYVADWAPDVAGAASGIAIDLVDATLRTAQRGAAKGADAVAAHLPEAIDRTKEAATRATHYVADWAPDIAESAHKTARAALDRQFSELGPRGSGKGRSR